MSSKNSKNIVTVQCQCQDAALNLLQQLTNLAWWLALQFQSSAVQFCTILLLPLASQFTRASHCQDNRCQSVVVRVWGGDLSLGPHGSTQDGSKQCELAVHLHGDHDNDSQKFAAISASILATTNWTDLTCIIQGIHQVLCMDDIKCLLCCLSQQQKRRH